VAKKKAARKATEKGNRKKPLGLASKAKDKGLKEHSNSDALAGPASTTDQSLLGGIASTRLITEVIRHEVDAAAKAAFGGALKGDLLRSLNSSIADVLKPLREAIDDLYSKIDEIPKRPTEESIQRLAEDRIKQAEIEAARMQLWATEWWESDHKQSSRRPPRPSIIGRAMHELQTNANGGALTPAAVFEQIEKRGSHHLPETVRELLRKYRTSGIGTKNKKDASGKLGTDLRARLRGLVTGLLATDEKGDLRLTPRGLLVFKGWPDWSVQGIDIGCRGRAVYAAGTPGSAADGGRSGRPSE
jgi:hypothetical protein